MSTLLIFGVPLVLLLVLCLVAGRRRWAPSLAVALGVGAALRIGMMVLAWRMRINPYDFGVDFPVAADNVLHLHDPVLNSREGGWHFMPLMAYVLAGQRWVSQATGLDWAIAGRLVPIAADLVLTVLVGKLSTENGALRRFQWACNPLAILVCAFHGQLEPPALAFGVGALLIARSDRPRRAVLAGLLLGLSIATNSWPVLLAPGVLLALPGLRRRVIAAATTGGVLLVTLISEPLVTPDGQGVAGQTYTIVRTLAHTRAVVGEWGWTAIATRGAQLVDPTIGTLGTFVLAAGLLAALWWWRRADPLTLTVAVLLAFLICTHRIGAQYLLWPLPYLFARPMRGTWPAFAAVTAWAGMGYLWLGGGMSYETWLGRHAVWALSSLAVIAVLVYALPWRRRSIRRDTRRREPAAAGATADPVPASAC